MRRVLAAIALALCLASCVTTPRLDFDGVAISQIVERIKCELAQSVPKFEDRYPTGQFRWMEWWTAKIDLTLETTETGAISSTNQFFDPRNPAPLPGVGGKAGGGSFAQSFSLNFGAAVNTSAYRNDKLSFTVSLKELQEQLIKPKDDKSLALEPLSECEKTRRLGLLGNLGLQEWIRSAVAPVGEGKLTIGYHAPPAAKPSPIPGPALEVEKAPKLSAPEKGRKRDWIGEAISRARGKVETAQKNTNQASAGMDDAERLVSEARRAANNATREAHNTAVKPIANRMQPTYDQAELAAQASSEALILIDQVKGFAWWAKAMFQDAQRLLNDLKSDKPVLDGAQISVRLKELDDTKSGLVKELQKRKNELPPADPAIVAIEQQLEGVEDEIISLNAVLAVQRLRPKWAALDKDRKKKKASKDEQEKALEALKPDVPQYEVEKQKIENKIKELNEGIDQINKNPDFKNLHEHFESMDALLAKIAVYLGKSKGKDTSRTKPGQEPEGPQDKQDKQDKEDQDQDKGVIADILNRAKEAGDQVGAARAAANAAWSLLPRDPPLNSIGHSVNFTVTASANASPNWTLLRYRGPSIQLPFASVQRLRVHKLDIVLGEPAEAGGKALSDEQRRQLFNQRLDQLQRFVVPIESIP